MARRRADLVLVERGFFESRARAQAAIAAGLVTADGATLRKASDTIAPDAAIEAQAPHPYVSRGGVKLAAALDAFAIDPSGLACIDVGASTGGFTDVLLRRGAARVTAVDVGTAQLHASLRDDARIRSLENCDIRTLTPTEAGAPFDLAAIDVSFIPLGHVLPAVASLMKPAATIVALVKPQFEVGRAALRKGIVRDEALREGAVAAAASLLDMHGFPGEAPIASPIAGGDGNVEYLVCGRRTA